jgi:hypothetical protein
VFKVPSSLAFTVADLQDGGNVDKVVKHLQHLKKTVK